MSKPDQQSKVSLEDLLRLKRAERPGPEFWSKFEAELRQKQLTALVQKRRWWHEMSALLSRRFYLPAGVAAAAACALVVVRYTVSVPVAQTSGSPAEVAVTEPSIEMLAATEVSGSALVQPGQQEQFVSVAAKSLPFVSASRDVTESAAAITLLREVETPSSHALMANFTRLEQAQSEFDDSVLSSRLVESTRVQPVSVAQAEVASMTTASASKYRLIARYADRALSPAPAAPAVVRERLARRLGDDLSDDISRIGVAGNGVSLKF